MNFNKYIFPTPYYKRPNYISNWLKRLFDLLIDIDINNLIQSNKWLVINSTNC